MPFFMGDANHHFFFLGGGLGWLTFLHKFGGIFFGGFWLIVFFLVSIGVDDLNQ